MIRERTFKSKHMFMLLHRNELVQSTEPDQNPAGRRSIPKIQKMKAFSKITILAAAALSLCS